MLIPDELSGGFRKRPLDAHKRSVGTVTVVGGSKRYSHAPVVAALGARAAGAGLVQLVVPAESRFAAAVHVPEATFASMAEGLKSDVVVAGMGLGTGADAVSTVKHLLAARVGRLVLDADALNVLAKIGVGGGVKSLVLTPHEGEAARLLGCERGDVAADRLGAARAIAGKYCAAVVLKGPGTLVVECGGGRVYRNATGNPFMALGGMGDLLAGVIGARWAYLKSDAFIAAATSVWLHGAAADEVVRAGRDPSIVNTAAAIGSLRVAVEGHETMNRKG